MKNEEKRSRGGALDSALREAVRRAVKKVGGVNFAASITRAHPSQLSRYSSAESDLFIPLDVAAVIDAKADDVILREWAHQRGFDLVRSDANDDGCGTLQTEIGAAALEFGELTNAGLHAVSDGSLTPREGREVLNAASDVQDKIVVIKKTAAAAMAGVAE